MGRADESNRVLRNANLFIAVMAVLSAPTTLFMQGTMILYIIALIIAAAIVAAISWRCRLNLRRYVLCIAISLVIIFAGSLIGFYGKNTEPYGYDSGLTWVGSKSPGIALTMTVTEPDVFVAASFGFSCDGPEGSDCSAIPLYSGVLATYGILTAGVVAGTRLARRKGFDISQ